MEQSSIKLPADFETYGEARKAGFLRMKQLKDQGARVVGMFCSFVPTELVYAAGALPVGLCAFTEEPIPAAEANLPRNLCPLIKASYGFALTDTCPYFYFSDFVVGETTVAIQHCLMALPGVKLEDIQPVYSHEQGLFQCEQYLNKHSDWNRVPQADTAGSANMVAKSGDRTKAAICSKRSADIYGLEILAEAINSNANNTTRFVVISTRLELRPDRDKVSTCFCVPHQSGSLHEILTIFAVHGLNMVRLESRPIQGRSWEYMFFLEFSGDITAPGMEGVFRELTQSADHFRVLGNFVSNLH